MSLNCPSFTLTQEGGYTPCYTAGIVDSSCGQNITISTTQFQETLYIPNATTADFCTCSWAAYNLLSACAVCVNQTSWASWGTYTASCGNFISSTTYFPSDHNYNIKNGVTIPYFSGTNPNTWPDSTFNEAQAAIIGSGDEADLTGSPLASTSPSSNASSSSTSSSKTSTSTIIGGVVGAIVLIAIAGFAAYFVLHHRRRKAHTQFLPSTRVPIMKSHSSQLSMRMAQAPISPYPFSSQGHGFSASSLNAVSPTSGIHTAPLSPPISDNADMISPFLASPTRLVRGSSKAAEAIARSTSPTSPPTQRARMNPPPYSPTAPATRSSGGLTSPLDPPPRKRSTKQQMYVVSGSVDTTHSGPSTMVDDQVPPPPPPPLEGKKHSDPRPRAVQTQSNGSTVSLNSTGYQSGSVLASDVNVGQNGAPRKRPPVV